MNKRLKHDDILKIVMCCYTVGMRKHNINISFPVGDPKFTKITIESLIFDIEKNYIKSYWHVENAKREIVELSILDQETEAI